MAFHTHSTSYDEITDAVVCDDSVGVKGRLKGPAVMTKSPHGRYTDSWATIRRKMIITLNAYLASPTFSMYYMVIWATNQ